MSALLDWAKCSTHYYNCYGLPSLFHISYIMFKYFTKVMWFELKNVTKLIVPYYSVDIVR